MSNLSGRSLGQYQLLEIVGSGGMAHIYRAHQTSIKRDVAVKVMSSVLRENASFVERFNREVQIAASLQHPHIVPVYDFGEQDGHLYIVMAYLTGHSLADKLEYAPNGLPIHDTIHIINLIAQGLDYAHQKGIIHRDLKPSNILFDERSNPYIADFGLAKATAEGQSDMTNSMMAGTPAYMAPEMISDQKLTASVDVYALGVIAYKMLTGKLVYEGDTPYKIISAHVNDPIPNILDLKPDLPPAVRDVFEKVFAKDPQDRFASALEFASALKDSFGFERFTPTEPQFLKERIKQVRKKNRTFDLRTILLGFGAITLLLLAALLALRGRATGQSTSYTPHSPELISGGADSPQTFSFGCLGDSATALQDLDCRKITIALENRYLPFNYIETSTQKAGGFDYDLWWEICSALHCEPVFVEERWDGLLEQVGKGKYDVGSGGVTITAERTDFLSFSQGYLNIEQRLVVRKGEPRFGNIMEFAERTDLVIGVQSDSTNLEVARKFLPESRIQQYKEYSLMVYALSIREVDALIIDQFRGQNFISGVFPDDADKLDIIGPSLSSDQLGLAFKKDSDLSSPVDRALGQLRAGGKLDMMIEHYFGPGFILSYDDVELGAYK